MNISRQQLIQPSRSQNINLEFQTNQEKIKKRGKSLQDLRKPKADADPGPWVGTEQTEREPLIKTVPKLNLNSGDSSMSKIGTRKKSSKQSKQSKQTPIDFQNMNFGGQSFQNEPFLHLEDDQVIISDDGQIMSQQRTIRPQSQYNGYQLPIIPGIKIDLDHLDLDNLDQSMSNIMLQNDYLPQIEQPPSEVQLAAQRLFQNNRNSTQQLQSIKKIIMNHDITGLGFTSSDLSNQQMAQKGINELLRKSGLKYRNNFVRKSNQTSEMRKKQQERVYQQNLGQLFEMKRSQYSKTQQEQMSQLPPEKNFIQKNRQKISQNQNTSKLDRLRKLQQQTSNLINHNLKLENPLDAEDFLQQSINQVMDSEKGHLQIQEPNFDVVQVQNQIEMSSSVKTLEQYKNLRLLSHQRKNQRMPGVSKSMLFSKSKSKSRSKSPKAKGPWVQKSDYKSSPKLPKRVRSQTANASRGRKSAIVTSTPTSKLPLRRPETKISADKTAHSQATTQKLSRNFIQKSSVQNLGNIHLNLDDNNLNKSHSQLNGFSAPENMSGVESIKELKTKESEKEKTIPITQSFGRTMGSVSSSIKRLPIPEGLPDISTKPLMEVITDKTPTLKKRKDSNSQGRSNNFTNTKGVSRLHNKSNMDISSNRSISKNRQQFHPGCQPNFDSSQIDPFGFKQLPQPIIDSEGNVAYDPKHRKPKWVLKSELERFLKFENVGLSEENSRNARIKMEDPFTRAPHQRHVFTHIKDTDIAKFIVGSSYLGKEKLDLLSYIGMHPDLNSQKLFIKEMMLDAGIPYMIITQQLAQDAIDLMAFEFKTFGLKDPFTNLRADPNFIVDYKKHDTHIEFRRCLAKRKGVLIKKFLFKEIFGESTKEWQMDYDPVNTLKRFKRYNRELPDHFVKRLEEIKVWHQIMDRRADFVKIQADQGKVINDIINGIMYQYCKHSIEEKKRIKKEKNEDDMKFVLEELKTAEYLKIPELQFERLQQQPREDFIKIYDDYFKYDRIEDTRDRLQQKISAEFIKLKPLMASYDLIEGSTFSLAFDQSDYKKRILFQESLLNSEKWDTGAIINDDVYRKKQRKKMISRLSLFDQSVLYEWGIEVPMLNCMNHLDLHVIILKNYFTFQKQDLFYYQWYADYLRNTSFNKRSEYVNFYKFKNIHETMESRQTEGFFSKQKILDKRHWDYREMQKSVARPTFTNIIDPKNNLIENFDKFYWCYKWFMKQFTDKRPLLPYEWKLNHEVIDLKRFIFFLHIDFNEDHDVGKSDDYPLQVDRKLNQLVFRTKHVIEDAAPYEVFESTYSLAEFQDQRDLHEALEMVVKDRLKQQYECQLELLRERKAIITKKLKRYQPKWNEAREKYVHTENRKPLKRAKSQTELPPLILSDDARDIRVAFIQQLAPLTLEFSPIHPAPVPKPMFRTDYRWEEPFLEPIRPYIEHYKLDYLQLLISQYQEERGIKSDEQIEKEKLERMSSKSRYSKQSSRMSMQSDQVFRPEEFQKAAELKLYKDSPRNDIGKYQAVRSPDDPLIRWLEDPLGENQGKSFLPVYENLDIEMGEGIPLFENLHFPVVKKQNTINFMSQDLKTEQELMTRTFQITPRDKLTNIDLESNTTSPIQKQQPLTSAFKVLKSDRNKVRPFSGLTNLLKKSDCDSSKMDIILVFEPKIPQYMPLHMCQDEMVQLRQEFEENQARSNIQSHLNLVLRKLVAKPKESQKITYGAKMNTSEKILGYVDKQVKKEILEAIRTADLPLLKNFIDQFDKSLYEQINQQDLNAGDGNTILHTAVLMDFEDHKSLINLGEVKISQDGTGGDDYEKIDMKTIKKHLAKEGANSSKIKTEVVKLLVQKAGANPNVKNNHDHTALQIAKNLKESREIVRVMERFK